MKKINQKVLNIPPYISTSWKNVNTLHMKKVEGKPILVITLHNNSTIEIPELENELIEKIFTMHSKVIEQESDDSQVNSFKGYKSPKEEKGDPISFSFGIPFGIGNKEGLGNVESFLQHNPEQAHAPDLPCEVLQKITSITKALGMNIDQINIAKAEPHCNCPYCQIARAIHSDNEDIKGEISNEEEVTEEDLRFRDWDIKQQGDKLYIVTNPLDANEHYQVYLGNPIGCTCGKKNCEHIRTVLNS